MKHFNFSMVTLLLIINFSPLFGQETDPAYKYARIHFNDGKMIKARNITIADDKVSYLEDVYVKQFDLGEIQSIEVATKNHWLTGLLVGAGVGIGATIGVTAYAQRTREVDGPPDEIPWWADGYEYSATNVYSGYTLLSSTSELTYDMAFAPKVMIFTACTGVGTLVGMGFKKGWETVFPESSSVLNRLDLNLAVYDGRRFIPGLNINYRF